MKLAAALTGLSGYLFLGYARDNKTSLSNLNQVNMELNVSGEFYELLILGSFLATSMVPQRLGITVLATLMFLKVFLEEASNQLNTDVSTNLGQSYRIYTVIAAVALSILNTEYIFLGAYVLLGVILYDLGLMFYSFYENKQGIKLKNRILSS
jgi:type III secretory pathway component EscV